MASLPKQTSGPVLLPRDIARKTASRLPPELADAETIRNPMEEYRGFPTPYRGISFANDVEARLAEALEKIQQERVKLVNRRIQGRGANPEWSAPSKEDIAFAIGCCPSFDPQRVMEEFAIRRRTLGRIFQDIDRASVFFSIPGWPAREDKQVSPNEQLDGYMLGKYRAEEQSRHSVIGAAWIGRILMMDEYRPFMPQEAWAALRQAIHLRFLSVREKCGYHMQVDRSGEHTTPYHGSGDHNEVKAFAMNERREIYRYEGLAGYCGWMILSILAYSATFRAAAADFDTETWQGLALDIHHLRGSIEMFAKSRNLDWHFPIKWPPPGCPLLFGRELGSGYQIDFTHPHEWYLPLQGPPQRIIHEGQAQRNIEACLYHEKVFGVGEQPATWPKDVPWPTDPRTIRDKRALCLACRTTSCRRCGPDHFLNPLVEIIEYEKRGRGVRALQEIPESSLLAEYVGFVLRPDNFRDTTYALALTARDCEVATISAKLYGNWTRYVNHSCYPNADLIQGTLRGRHCIVLHSRGRIQALEEITIDYGASYFHENRFCLCGLATCKYDTRVKVRAAREREGLRPQPLF